MFPAVAAKIKASLRAKAHAYDNLTTAAAFAEALQKDLQAVSHDLHMRVRARERIPDDPANLDADPSDAERAEIAVDARRRNAGFVEVKRLPGNIGYLRLDNFFSPEEAGPRAAAAMTFLADTDALIIDLRDNHGGDPATVAIMVSYLYNDYDTVHINDIYWRPDNSTRQFWNAPSLPGRRYPKKPVYALSSKRTFSGGEELLYDLKNLKRATLVGETSGGGANPGGPVKVSEHLQLFVPAGRAVNPVSKTNWEGVGVVPDVATSAEKAFDTAYLAALKVQKAKIIPKDAPQLADEIDDALAALAKQH